MVFGGRRGKTRKSFQGPGTDLGFFVSGSVHPLLASAGHCMVAGLTSPTEGIEK